MRLLVSTAHSYLGPFPLTKHPREEWAAPSRSAATPTSTSSQTAHIPPANSVAMAASEAMAASRRRDRRCGKVRHSSMGDPAIRTGLCARTDGAVRKAKPSAAVAAVRANPKCDRTGRTADSGSPLTVTTPSLLTSTDNESPLIACRSRTCRSAAARAERSSACVGMGYLQSGSVTECMQEPHAVDDVPIGQLPQHKLWQAVQAHEGLPKGRTTSALGGESGEGPV